MKNHFFNLLAGAALASALAIPGTALGEPPLEQIRLSVAAGTIASIESKLITLRPDSSQMPSKFIYDTGTKFMDTAGSPVAVDIIRPGDPATIHYSQNGQQYIAERVIVKPMDAEVPSTATTTEAAQTTKTETPVATSASQTTKKKEIISPYGVASTESTSTTTTATKTDTIVTGDVSSVDPKMVVLRTETADAPARYTFTKTTEFINEEGQPVSIKTVKTGVPLTIQYVKQGSQAVAQKVVVRKTVSTTR